MTNITIYDVEAELIDKAAEELDTTVAEVVWMLCDYLNEVVKENM